MILAWAKIIVLKVLCRDPGEFDFQSETSRDSFVYIAKHTLHKNSFLCRYLLFWAVTVVRSAKKKQAKQFFKKIGVLESMFTADVVVARGDRPIKILLDAAMSFERLDSSLKQLLTRTDLLLYSRLGKGHLFSKNTVETTNGSFKRQ